MIIDDLDVEGVSIIETKYDAPRTIDANRPKARTIANELVQANAAQARQIVQLSRYIQR